MRAIVFDGKPSLQTDYPAPVCGADEALIDVHLAGVCRTDLEILRGYMHFRGVMGHEFVGTVAAGPEAWKGRRVVGEINCACLQCDMCRRGDSNHCRHRTVIGIDGRDGAFAQQIALPVRNLHLVPDRVPDEHAVFIEPLAAACQILRQVRLEPTSDVVILGDGRLGQLIARVVKTRALAPLLVGKHRSKLQTAETQHIRTVLLGDYEPTRSADVVIDATGTAAGFAMAMRAVRPKGIIVLKSTFAAESGMNLATVVIDELTVLGSRCGPFSDAIRALAEGEVEVSSLISRTFGLCEGLRALQAAQSGDCLKVLLDARR